MSPFGNIRGLPGSRVLATSAVKGLNGGVQMGRGGGLGAPPRRKKYWLLNFSAYNDLFSLKWHQNIPPCGAEWGVKTPPPPPGENPAYTFN